MTSISLPASSSPFMNPTLGSPSMSIHTRRHSRNPSRNPAAAQLPAFSFNPGVADKDTENQPPSDDTMARSPPRGTAKPAPLPAFSFNPGADLPVEDRPSPTHPVLEEMVMNQQRMSRSARPAPLPAFTFAPGNTTQTTPSPTKSEFNEGSQPRPVGGHKRAGSEFVGGGGGEGPTLLSTSPARNELRTSGPPMANSGRRGHAHRRSQAVSISDIDTSDLIKAHAVAKHRTSSTPASGPSTPSDPTSSFIGHDDTQSKQSISLRSPPSSPRRRGSAPGVRPRVEFADKIDVIPRPLSMISSETEGSCSTAHYSHSMSNSINSIASPSRVLSATNSPTPEESPKQRPNTADPASLLVSISTLSERRLDELSLPKRPLSASGSPAIPGSGGPPIKKKHFWFNHVAEQEAGLNLNVRQIHPIMDLPEFAPMKSAEKVRPKTSPERSLGNKSRKYHTWTSGIFSKKTKYRTSKPKGRRTPTPPTLQRRASDKVNQIFDADDTIVIRAESPEVKRTLSLAHPVTLSPPTINIQDEVSSPVLDLDAALGPFGSEERLGVDHHGRSASSRLAKLHSSERRGNLDAFGTVHRRTESAPTMPVFNRNGFGLARHGSNPSLAEEVFDEEEEDIFLAGEKTTKTLKREVGVIDPPPSQKTAHSLSDSKHVDGLGLTNIVNVNDAVIILDADIQADSNEMHSSTSTIEAPLYGEVDVPKRPASSPMSFAYPSTQSHYASSTEGRTTTSASMISSPDPDHVQFDNIPRLAPSISQHSPDCYLRPSNDDLPSLSDSISSGALPRVSSSANTRSSVDQRPEQRSASMFVPGTSRPGSSWKRNSLASLNRLIPGSANGSKLKFETAADMPVDEKTKKKTNRLSKLVNFWRFKDRLEN